LSIKICCIAIIFMTIEHIFTQIFVLLHVVVMFYWVLIMITKCIILQKVLDCQENVIIVK